MQRTLCLIVITSQQRNTKKLKSQLNSFGAIDVKTNIPENIQVPSAPVAAGGNNGIPETLVQKWTQAGIFSPQVEARAFILMDANTGQIIAANDANMRMAPARHHQVNANVHC